MREALLLTGELAERWGQPALLIDSPEAYASIDQAVKFFVDLSSLPMFQQEAETANAGAALQRQLLRAALLCARKLFESPPSPEKLAGALQHHVALLQQAVPLDGADAAAVEGLEREAASLSSEHQAMAAAAAHLRTCSTCALKQYCNGQRSARSC